MRPRPDPTWQALSSRLAIARSSRAGAAAHQARLGVEREAAARGVQSRPLERAGGGEVEANVLDLDLLDLGLGEVDEVADEHGQLAQLCLCGGDDACALMRGQLLAERERVEVGLHAGQRCAQLVRGVGDELALSQARALERGQHRVEARREPSQLVLLVRLDAMAEVLCAGHAFGGAGQPADGHQRRA